MSEAVLRRLREATAADGYQGPSFSFSMASQSIVGGESTQNILEHIARLSELKLSSEQLVSLDAGNAAALNTWLNRLSAPKDAQNSNKKWYYQSLARILNLADRDESYRTNVFLPVVEEAATTCGDRIALSILHLDIRRQILDFDKRNLIDFADFLCRGVMALSLLEDIARRKIPQLRFYDEIEVYLSYPIKLKEALALPICLHDMLYFRCSSLVERDLDQARTFVQAKLDSKTERVDFLIQNLDWVAALNKAFPEDMQQALKETTKGASPEDMQQALKEITKKNNQANYYKALRAITDKVLPSQPRQVGSG